VIATGEPHRRFPLSDICTRISSGGTPSRKRSDYFADGTGHPWVKSQELLDTRIWQTSEHISDAGLQNSSAKYYPPLTVLVAMYGANVGQIGLLGIAATVNQAICGLCVDGAVADARYVFYALLHTRGDLVGQAAGAAQQNLNQESIRRFRVPLPPLTTQRKIAAILSACDDLVENSNRRIKLLEEMAQRVYREWFVDFRYPGHEDVPLVESELGPIPEGWGVEAFTDLADILSGGTPRTTVAEYWDGEIPFFTPRDAPDALMVNSTEKSITQAGLEHCNSQLYPPGTIFITARGTVGKVAMVALPMAMNQSCYAVCGRERVPQEFLLFTLLNQVDYLKANTGGATFDTIIVDTFRRMRSIVPPRKLIASFAAVTAPFLRMIHNLQRTTGNTRTTRDLLLPRLISGEIDVDNLDIRVEEPAA
jgi:type I restriction enzyme S subunit